MSLNERSPTSNTYHYNITMANRRKKPVIPFDFEPDYSIPMEYIRHQLRTRTENDEDVVEEKLQRLHEEASPYEMLQFFSAFQRVRSSMNWAEGPKLYQKFPYISTIIT